MNCFLNKIKTHEPATRSIQTTPSASERGFTLIEIMIALALLAGVVVTVITSLNFHLGAVERTRDISVATMLARGKLEEIRLEGAPEKLNGRFSDAFERFKWSYLTEPYDVPGVKKVYMTVSWDSGGGGGVNDKGSDKVTIETYEKADGF